MMSDERPMTRKLIRWGIAGALVSCLTMSARGLAQDAEAQDEVTPGAEVQAPVPQDEEPPPPVKKEKPKAVAIGSFLQAGVGPAWNVSAPEFDRYRDELFAGEEASGRVTWGRFAWAVEDTPAYFQAGVMRTGGRLAQRYDGSGGTETFSLEVRALSVDLGVGAQWTAPEVNPFSFYGDAALVIVSTDTVVEAGTGGQRNEDTNVTMLVRGGVRVAIYGPVAADFVLHLGGMMDRALTGGLSYVF
jgi:hypothetical protein